MHTFESGVSDQLNDYLPFRKEELSLELSGLTKNTDYAGAAFEFLISLEGASNVRSFPFTLVNSTKSITDIFIQNYNPPTLEVVTQFIMGIRENHPTLGLTLKQVKRLAKYFGEMQTAHRERMESNPPEYPIQEVWESLVVESVFKLMLYQSEMNAFSAVYFAYERYYKNCIERKWPRDYRDLKEYGKSLRGHDDEAWKKCWEHRDVNIARLARSAIVHNGGKETDKLKALTGANTHPFEVSSSGQLIIGAKHTTALYNICMDRAIVFTRSILSPPKPPA